MKNHILAQSMRVGGQPIEGPLKGIDNLGGLVSKLLEFLTPVALVILFFVFVWGGYDLLLSQGNPEKVKSAKAKFTTGIIGFILIISAYIIVRLLSAMFGLGKGAL